MQFSTSTISNFAGTRLGLIECQVVCQESPNELLLHLNSIAKRKTESLLLSDVNKIAAIAEARKAYKICGNDPNRYRPSADSLIRRVVKGSELYYINNVVDSLNLVSIETGFSIGGYDTSKICGDIFLGIGERDEPYIGIGRGELNIESLPVLRDDAGAFGSPTSDSVRTLIDTTTTSVLLVVFDFGQNPVLDNAVELLSGLLLTHCKGSSLSVHNILYK